MLESPLTIGEILTISSALVVMITFLWKGLGRPNIEQDKKISLLEHSSDLNINDHKEISEKFNSVNAKIEVILTNHLPHIQQEITEIKTILCERLPQKK